MLGPGSFRRHSYVFGLACGYVMAVAGDELRERSRGQEKRADVSG